LRGKLTKKQTFDNGTKEKGKKWLRGVPDEVNGRSGCPTIASSCESSPVRSFLLLDESSSSTCLARAPVSVAGTAMNTSGDQQLQQMINTSTARTREDTKCFGAAKGAAFSDLVLLFIESQS
jgi:hypothetical protein